MRVQEARVLELKLLVLTAAVTEIARALSPQDAASVARSLAALLTGLLDEARLSDRADEALACDLAPLMAALRREPSSSEGLVTRVAGGERGRDRFGWVRCGSSRRLSSRGLARA